MSTILGSFKIKPFDLEPIYASWPDAPKFLGKPKKDPPVDEWLKQIKAGCIERKVPQEYWPKVAQHYMGDKAKARLNELKAVMEKVHGGKYKWTWKKYKIAMRNMGWTIETTATQAIEVQGKSSSWQWLTWKKPETEEPQPMQRPSHVKSSTTDSSFWKNSKLSKGDNEFEIVPQQRPVPTKSTTTDSSFWSALTSSKPDSKENASTPAANATRPVPTKSKTDSFWITRKPSVNDSPQPQPQVQAQRPDFVTSISNSVLSSMTTRGTPNPVQPARVDSTDVITTVANAPTWLLNACNALDFLNTEHPKVMSTISAILITVGTLPAIPAISAGAGGAVLASGAAHAVGAIAVGVGSWLRGQQEGQVQVTNRS